MTRHQRRDLFRIVGTLVIVLGVLGSLTAWENGQIGFWQLVVQVSFSVQASYLAFAFAANTHRHSRKTHKDKADTPLEASAVGRAA